MIVISYFFAELVLVFVRNISSLKSPRRVHKAVCGRFAFTSFRCLCFASDRSCLVVSSGFVSGLLCGVRLVLLFGCCILWMPLRNIRQDKGKAKMASLVYRLVIWFICYCVSMCPSVCVVYVSVCSLRLVSLVCSLRHVCLSKCVSTQQYAGTTNRRKA